MRNLIKLWRERANGWGDGMFDAFALRSDESREKRIARTFRICANELEECLDKDDDSKKRKAINKRLIDHANSLDW